MIVLIACGIKARGMARAATGCSIKTSRHRPPPGRRSAPPDDRLQRAIQYPGHLGSIATLRRTGYPLSRGMTPLAEQRALHRVRDTMFCANGYRFAK
jgi:hypothetical protein